MPTGLRVAPLNWLGLLVVCCRILTARRFAGNICWALWSGILVRHPPDASPHRPVARGSRERNEVPTVLLASCQQGCSLQAGTW